MDVKISTAKVVIEPTRPAAYMSAAPRTPRGYGFAANGDRQ
ncbi:MAG: hypothetical protein ACRD9W_09010 [Terriglobia bacterium]